MAANKKVRFGPVALTSTYTTNLLNPGTTTGGVNMPSTSTNLYFVIYHIKIFNKTNAAVTCRLYIGATGANAAGTEVAFDLSVPANSSQDLYDLLTLDIADFLVGGASANTSLVLMAEGEIGVR